MPSLEAAMEAASKEAAASSKPPASTDELMLLSGRSSQLDHNIRAIQAALGTCPHDSSIAQRIAIQGARESLVTAEDIEAVRIATGMRSPAIVSDAASLAGLPQHVLANTALVADENRSLAALRRIAGVDLGHARESLEAMLRACGPGVRCDIDFDRRASLEDVRRQLRALSGPTPSTIRDIQRELRGSKEIEGHPTPSISPRPDPSLDKRLAQPQARAQSAEAKASSTVIVTLVVKLLAAVKGYLECGAPEPALRNLLQTIQEDTDLDEHETAKLISACESLLSTDTLRLRDRASVLPPNSTTSPTAATTLRPPSSGERADVARDDHDGSIRSTPGAQLESDRLLYGWREICEALDWRYRSYRTLKNRNDASSGPIKSHGTGKLPTVRRQDLREWFNTTFGND